MINVTAPELFNAQNLVVTPSGQLQGDIVYVMVIHGNVIETRFKRIEDKTV
jgi:hypothetical protein